MNKKWDLVVVGGGFTGICAAIAAKRQGLEKVLIVEKAGFLGGAPMNNLVNPFMPYWTMVEENGKKKRFDLSRGIFTEIVNRLSEMEASISTRFHEEYLKVLFDRFVKEEKVDVLFHATLCGVEKEGETITKVNFATKAGVLGFTADYYIDATGDADLSVMSGCPYKLGRDEDELCQPMTLCFRIVNVDIEQFKKDHPTINPLYIKEHNAGKIKNPRTDVLLFHTTVDGMIHLNTTRVIKLSPVDPFDVTKAEMIAREQMLEMHDFLKRNFESFKNSQIAFSAPAIGVRESRKVQGAFILNQDHLKECIKFEDRIAAGNYDIDIHNPAGGDTSHYYFPDGTWYTIPYRALLPLKADNLLVAGRCISSTHEAQASYRILPIVSTLGEAAGVAAAVASKEGVKVKDVTVPEVQRILTESGAFIG